MMKKELVVSSVGRAVSSTLLAISLAVSVGCGGEAETSGDLESAARHIDRAESYREEGQYRAALIEAQNAVEKSSDKATAFATLAAIYNDLGDYQAAIDASDKLVGEAQSEGLKLQKLDAYLSQGRLRSAKTVLDEIEASEKIDDALEYGLQKAVYLRSIGDVEGADNLYQALIADNPDDLELRLASVEFDFLRGEDEAANKALADLEALAGGSSKFLYLKAVSHVKQQQLAPAELRLNEALAIRNADDVSTPARLQIQIQLERLLDLQGRSVEASQLREQMLLRDVDMSEARINEALRLFEAGDIDEALAAINGVIDKQPDSAVANLLKGAMLYEQRRHGEAAELFDDYLDFELYNPELVQVGANAMLQAGYQEQLIEKLNSYEGLNNDPLALKAYARALVAEQREQEAADALQKAIAVASADTESYLLLDSLYQQNAALAESSGPVSDVIAGGVEALREQTENAGQAPRVGQEYLEIARALVIARIREGDIKGAQTFVDAERAATGSNAETLHLAAIQAAAQGDAEGARDFAAASLEKDPSDAELWFALANAERQSGGSFEAIRKALTSGVEQRAADGASYYRAMSFAQDVDELNALAKGLESVTERYQQPQGLRAIARAYLDQGQAETAAGYLDRFREKIDEPLAAPRLAGRIASARVQDLWQSGEREAAFATLNDAIEKAPKSTNLMSLMVRLHASNQDFASAEKWAGKLAEVDQVAGLVHRGELHKLQGKNVEALEAYRGAWAQSPQDPIAVAIYGLLAADNEAKNEFLKNWESEIPQSGARLQLLVGEALQRGDTVSAVSLSEQLLEINPGNYMALNNLAWLYQNSGDSRALALAQRAYALAPNEPEVLDTYAWILAENGKPGEAIPLFERALTLAPDSASIKSNLEKAQQRL